MYDHVPNRSSPNLASLARLSPTNFLNIAPSHVCLMVVSTSGKLTITGPEKREHVTSQADSVTFKCPFHSDTFNLFDYPFRWKKHQLDETTEMNTMGNLVEPFLNGRFHLSYSNNSLHYILELSIINISMEDEANYTCEIRGPTSKVEGQVVHHLYVRG
ncbi:hypothetical protein HELRODRAFT_180649 [Helobdella robusta]|uniref:Ig-like domain-containing protein n=1 Tax=Helobdella robusta TaxID=6412 RepID=T1FG45_HELRO|nr:hypothetical protein HELRODRAFT_180649 [Helobdella robusta]ESN93781.1 hypothetical protein HELRODRAFT_180649 [Helobdella robusta]